MSDERMSEFPALVIFLIFRHIESELFGIVLAAEHGGAPSPPGQRHPAQNTSEVREYIHFHPDIDK